MSHVVNTKHGDLIVPSGSYPEVAQAYELDLLAANNYGIAREPGETDMELRARCLDASRPRPMSATFWDCDANNGTGAEFRREGAIEAARRESERIIGLRPAPMPKAPDGMLIKGQRGQWYRADHKSGTVTPFTPACDSCGDSGMTYVGNTSDMQPCDQCGSKPVWPSDSRGYVVKVRGADDFKGPKGKVVACDEPERTFGVRPCECGKEKHGFIGHADWCPSFETLAAMRVRLTQLEAFKAYLRDDRCLTASDRKGGGAK